MTQATTALATVPFHKIPIDKLVAACKQDPERAAATIRALAAFNTVDLPTTAFVRRGEDLMLKKVMRIIELTSANGELERIKDGYQITAAGYRRLNQTAGIHIYSPQTVVVESKNQPNPFVQDDPVSGRPMRVYCRKIAIGPSPETGNLVASDVMVRLDLDLYFIESLIAKMRDANADRFICYGTKDEPPEAAQKTGGKGWRFIAVQHDVGIWYRIADGEIGKVLSNQISRLKFADRIAQTVAERNAMKAHPSMPSSTRECTEQNRVGRLKVQMVGWTATATDADVRALRELVEAGRLHEKMQIVATSVAVEDIGTQADESDATEEGEGTPQIVDQAPALEQEDKPTNGKPEAENQNGPPLDVLIEDAEARAEGLRSRAGENILKAKLKEVGIESIDKIKTASREALLKFLE